MSEKNEMPDASENGDEIPLSALIEAVLFVSQKPVGAEELAQIFKGAAAAKPEDPARARLARMKEPQLRAAVEELSCSYRESGRSFMVRESAAGWQLVTRPEFAPWLRQLFPENRPAKLSAPALETLAIIAYRQPLTRADIEAVRGVAVDGVMQTLLDRGLIKIAGRADVPGRPLLYETTQHFMEHFGLRDLTELPNAGELRQVPLPKAEPATVQAEKTPPTEAATPTGEGELPRALPQELPFGEKESLVTSGEDPPTGGEASAEKAEKAEEGEAAGDDLGGDTDER